MNIKLTNISVIKDLAKRHGFTFSKSLGQNFLINPSVCPKMAQAACGSDIPEARDTTAVVEIGAGIGVLTRELSKTADKVTVIEIDESLKPVLAETLSDCNNVEIIWGDVLKLDLKAVFAERVSVAANLPYYAATHIIMKLLEIPNIDRCVVMVQEEVAQRFTAVPSSKHYGIVSVAAKFYSEPKLLFKVSRGSFMPAPNVDSAVIQLDLFRKRKYDIDKKEEKAFFRLVKAAFSERRKQLVNPVSKELGISKETVKSALTAIGKNTAARAEELSVDEFVGLYGGLGLENHKN